MMDSIREKFQEVQQDITMVSSSINKMSLVDAIKPVIKSKRNKDTGAGAELLSRYQSQWHDLHSGTQVNAKMADEVGHIITDVHAKLDHKLIAISEFDSLVSSVLTVSESIRNIDSDLQAALTLVSSLEQVIDEFELRQEVEDRDRMQLDAKYKLALYKERRAREFEQFREELERKHLDSVKRLELAMKDKLKERQEAFDQAFKEDIDQFKQLGKVERSHHVQSDVRLEEVDVEPEPEDKDALDDFLKDSTEN
ncbi:Dysbindin -like protein [Halotydeus destructor]|nr:Dysbindin -like protein [Halotydeus destructor]